jgi:outer membrane biosynthesis protein TonB
LLLASLPAFGQAVPSATSAASPLPPLPAESRLEDGVNTSGFQLLTAGAEPAPGPYLSRILIAIRSKWYPGIRDLRKSAGWKRGTTVIELEIKKNDGSLRKMTTIASAGDPALDQAAADAVAPSAPFGRVPEVYRDKVLKLRMYFGYNQPFSADAPTCDDRNHPIEWESCTN